MVWGYQWCGVINGVGLSMVWGYRWCGVIDGVGLWMVWDPAFSKPQADLR